MNTSVEKSDIISASTISTELPAQSPDTQTTRPKETRVFTVDHIPYDVWIAVFEVFILLDNGGCAKLLAVCKYWRNVIKSTSSLWSNISIHSQDLASENLEDRFSKINPRAILALDISCPRSSMISGWVDVSWLPKHIPKIRSLRIQHGLSLQMFRWHQTFENLGTLSVGCLSRNDMRDFQKAVRAPGNTEPFQLLQAPNLRRLSLHNISTLYLLPLPFHQIISLVLKDIRDETADQFYGMLVCQLRQLKHLEAAISFWEPDFALNSISEWKNPKKEFIPLPHQNLVSLNVQFGEDTQRFLDRLTLPKLEHLSVTAPRNEIDFWFCPFTKLAKRSAFPLKTLVMKNSPIILADWSEEPAKVHVVESVLRAAPSITSVVVENSAPISLHLIKALESPELGPNLRYLKFICLLSDFDGHTVDDMPGPRLRITKRAREPRDVNASQDSDDEECEDSDEEGPDATEDEDEGEEDEDEDEGDEEGEAAWREKLEKRIKFEVAADAARVKLLNGFLETMLGARNKDGRRGHTITASESNPSYNLAAVVRANKPAMNVYATKDFEEFCVREGEIVREAEVQRVHVFI